MNVTESLTGSSFLVMAVNIAIEALELRKGLGQDPVYVFILSPFQILVTIIEKVSTEILQRTHLFVYSQPSRVRQPSPHQVFELKLGPRITSTDHFSQ